jgi:hypothetical protein
VVVKENEDRAEKNRPAIVLLDAWAADKSGYDERVWPTVKKLLEENHSGPRAQQDCHWHRRRRAGSGCRRRRRFQKLIGALRAGFPSTSISGFNRLLLV